MDAGDFLLRFKLEGFGPDGKLISVQGTTMLPDLLAPYALGETLKRAENCLFDNVSAVFVRKLTQIVTARVRNKNPLLLED